MSEDPGRGLFRTLALTAIAFVGGTLYAQLGRGYPWFLALFLGAAIAALVFSIQRTGSRLQASRRKGVEPQDD